MGYDVIYGDTDSIMINTNSTSLPDVRVIGNKIKKEVNNLYKLLEIEIDGIYKMMLLLKKKKYAALVVAEKPDGTVGYKRELKGLDMVRRDWCPLSKEAGHRVVDLLMSGQSRDTIVETLHEYMRALAVSVREGKEEDDSIIVPRNQGIKGCEKYACGNFKLTKYVITKGINKLPHEYPNAKSQPHLQVAIRMIAAGKPVNTGDHIPYVICNSVAVEGGKSKVGGSVGAALRARHPDELRRSWSQYLKGVQTTDEHGNKIDVKPLQIDREWYLSNQILPPISRLTAVIDGTSTGALADAMGLDSRRYRQTYGNGDDGGDDDWAFAAAKNVSDAEKFKEAFPLLLQCGGCNHSFVFNGALGDDVANAVAAKKLVGAAQPTIAPGGLPSSSDSENKNTVNISSKQKNVLSKGVDKVKSSDTDEPVVVDKSIILSANLGVKGVTCPYKKCGKVLSNTCVANQLTLAVRDRVYVLKVEFKILFFRTKICN